MVIPVNLGVESYDIILEKGAMMRAKEYLNLNRKVLIVTDSGVPGIYAENLARQCKTPVLAVLPQGEESKSIACFEKLLGLMLESGFTRKDCVAAVGGGVVGDLGGFAAACYMRGIDFYNLPTTVLSQVDSSIGGKTAVNLCGIKNVVGAFYQPKRVLIDPQTLQTLPRRQLVNGLAEAVKMALTSDKTLFEHFEEKDVLSDPIDVIAGSIRIKKAVVEQDEKEQGLRRILNFGHTIGHGIESVSGLYHGESVALGMLPMCGEKVRRRLHPVLEKLGLPTSCIADREKVYAALLHDKKASGGKITVVRVEEIGTCFLEEVAPERLKEKLGSVVREK